MVIGITVYVPNLSGVFATAREISVSSGTLVTVPSNTQIESFCAQPHMEVSKKHNIIEVCFSICLFLVFNVLNIVIHTKSDFVH